MNDLSQITTVCFDGDDTLWDYEAAMRRCLGLALERMLACVRGAADANMTVDRMIEIREAAAFDPEASGMRLEDVRLLAFKRTLESLGCNDESLAAELNDIYVANRFACMQPYEDVCDVLGALRDRFTLGYLSNGNSHPTKCGVPDCFSFVMFAEDYGVRKPDPAIFAAACGHAGCSEAQMIHIGDSLEADVAGANGCGAVSIWLNRSGVINVSDVRPHFEVRSLAAVVDLLDTHGR